VRGELTRERLRRLLRAIAQSAPSGGPYRVYVVGGGTAVHFGWRRSTVDADLFSEQDEVFREIQEIKERLRLNVEFARPEHFVPALPGSAERHVRFETIGPVTFYHYDPYAQTLAKVVRGFQRDLEDAASFVREGLVDPARLAALVREIPRSAWARYPSLAPSAVVEVVDRFAAGFRARA
jgi:hypothetical protein